MTELLLDKLRIDTPGDQPGCISMPEVMKADARETGLLCAAPEDPLQVIVLEGPAVFGGEDRLVVVGPVTGGQDRPADLRGDYDLTPGGF